MWLDAAVRRKRKILADGRMFKESSRLPAPAAFVPGAYKAEAAVVASAIDGVVENEERLMDAMDELGEAADVAARNAIESVGELEQLLVNVFTDADKDGNGYLDRAEFSELLDTADLGLEGVEKMQLLAMCDVNNDNKIEYAEFAAFGADVIQTMRVRKLNAMESEVIDAAAELRARETLHALSQEEMTMTLQQAFTQFDTDGSGRLERGEIVECLNSLTLGSTKLTQREIRMIMAYIDADESGTIEYNEFAPLMFNWMVEALKIGFLESETTELEMYLHAHCRAYDASGSGYLSYNSLKSALNEIDILTLTPVQIHSVLADATYDKEDRVEISTWVGPASRLIHKFLDPTLEHKRAAVSKMATVTPLQALTAEEKDRLAQIAGNVFKQYDADNSGTLDRQEFQRCLTESKLGFSERQIAHMMAAADTSEDGLIDYSEFADLFNGCILELARMDAVEKMFDAEAAAASVPADLMMLLDELMIPLHIAFDIASEGSDDVAVDKLLEMLKLKASEWGLGEPAIELLSERITAQLGASVAWPSLVELIERLAMETELE